MRHLNLLLTALSAAYVAYAAPGATYVDWKTFKSNGANLGAWLVQEKSLDTPFWDQHGGNATDEWGLCVNLGSRCGPVLEQRYASFITTATIDKLAKAGFSSFRIPTHYAAWINVPGSELYSGNQVNYLKTISTYAINKYGMHVIIGLHSLPGGVNGRKLLLNTTLSIFASELSLGMQFLRHVMGKWCLDPSETSHAHDLVSSKLLRCFDS